MAYEQYLKKGLSTIAATKKLEKNGPNKIGGKKAPSDLYFFVAQFKNPLVLVLLIAALVTFFMHEVTDTIVIGMAIGLNAILGFIQEKKAYKSMESLRNALSYKTWVLRDGNKKEVDVDKVVTGDLLWLYEGDVIPADGVVMQTDSLLVNEAIITGESDAVVKSGYNPTQKDNEGLLAHVNSNFKNIKKDKIVFAGTNVVSGTALVIVNATGMKTKMGEIASHIDEHKAQKTPLEKRLDAVAKFITIGVVCISIGIFIYGISTGRDFEEMFTISVALAVAAIPEGLVIALTAILAIGMQRILKKNALVRNLMAAETLGTVNCVCVDKTGTLTEGKLRVVDTKFSNDKLAYKASIIANDMRDSVEISRWEWAKKLAKKEKGYDSPNEILEDNPKDETIPFSSETRFLATRVKNEIFISGSPEELLKKSSLSANLIKKEIATINDWASQGKRLLGFAYIKSRSEADSKKIFTKLKKAKFNGTKITWLGLIAFTDPVRKDVAKTIAKAKRAGVDFKVITGDFKNTAMSVAKQIGLEIGEGEIIEGSELENMNDKKLSQIVNKIVLFARTSPSQKLRIVNALKKNKKVIGMMGDGVNDAPALAAADIGMVVSEASQISKDAADMVLLDSNLKTIIDAIEEGRGIFDNLQKIILYLLSDTFSEVIIIIASLALGLPPLITAGQILWINLIDDGLPSLALTFDPKAKNLLKRKPIGEDEQIINGEIRLIIFLASIVSAATSLAVFLLTRDSYGYIAARTMVFAIMGIDSLFYIFTCKNTRKSIWEYKIFNNKQLNISVLISFILMIVPIYVPFLQTVLKISALNVSQWGIVAAASLSVMVAIEGVKWIYKRVNSKA